VIFPLHDSCAGDANETDRASAIGTVVGRLEIDRDEGQGAPLRSRVSRLGNNDLHPLLPDLPWMKGVIPLRAYGMRFQPEALDVLARYFSSSRVKVFVRESFDTQSGHRARSPDVP